VASKGFYCSGERLEEKAARKSSPVVVAQRPSLREKLLRVEVAHHFLMREKNWWPEQCAFSHARKTFLRKNYR